MENSEYKNAVMQENEEKEKTDDENFVKNLEIWKKFKNRLK